MKNSINRKCLFKEKGFNWENRYSENGHTDKQGRWSRICYYNGLQISWINGYIKQDMMPFLESGRIGVCNHFIVNLGFPTSSQQISGMEDFSTIEEAIQYTEDIFNDFKNIINE